MLRRVIPAPREQMIEQTFKDLIVPLVVGVGEGAAVDILHAQVVPAGLECIPSSYDVPDALIFCLIWENRIVIYWCHVV